MEIITSPDPVPYPDALAWMERRVDSIRHGTAAEALWFLEHPPIYTAGTSAKAEDLRDPRFPVFETGRGGQYTYHGPGQRVVYVMLDLKKHSQAPDLKKYVWQLEEWIISALACFEIAGERRTGRIGIWVQTPEGECKIAAIGVRVRHWVTFHGISINLNPDLSHFGGIVPCGIQEYGGTSRHALGAGVGMSDLDHALQQSWAGVFGQAG